jgi:hypothetical protein
MEVGGQATMVLLFSIKLEYCCNIPIIVRGELYKIDVMIRPFRNATECNIFEFLKLA